MRQLHVWFWPAKLLICDQTRMFFLEIYMVVYREKTSNCTYGNNLKSYIEYKRVNRKAKGRQLGPQQHAPSRQDVLINSEMKCTCFFCAFRLVFSPPRRGNKKSKVW